MNRVSDLQTDGRQGRPRAGPPNGSPDVRSKAQGQARNEEPSIAAPEPGAGGAATAPLALGSGMVTFLVALAAAFLPLLESIPKGAFLGALLLVAGLIELAFAGPRVRDPVGTAAAASGGITALAGLLFILVPNAGFFPVAPVITAWLLVRGACVLALTLPIRGTWTRSWLLLSGGVDILLGLLLAKGIRATAFVSVLFGPTREMVASFALILALSFAFTGIAQIAIGLRRQARSPA